jgi:hypothetical protein
MQTSTKVLLGVGGLAAVAGGIWWFKSRGAAPQMDAPMDDPFLPIAEAPANTAALSPPAGSYTQTTGGGLPQVSHAALTGSFRKPVLTKKCPMYYVLVDGVCVWDGF